MVSVLPARVLLRRWRRPLPFTRAVEGGTRGSLIDAGVFDRPTVNQADWPGEEIDITGCTWRAWTCRGVSLIFIWRDR